MVAGRIAALGLALAVAGPRAAAGAVVQIDVTALLDADVVVNNGLGPVDTSQVPVDDGLAGGNYCLLTQGYALFRNPASPDGLPDDASFAATALHPDVVLHWRNDDDGPNARRLLASGDAVTFATPRARYTELHLFALTGSGSAVLAVRLDYGDGSSDSPPPVTVPDWFDDPADGPARYRLIDGMDRVQANGVGTYEDFDDPALFGFRFDPDPAKELVSVTLTRTTGTLAVLNFFGATGVTTASPLPTVYEAAVRFPVVAPGNAVGTATASPFDLAPAAGDTLYYQVDDGAGAPPLVRLVRNGTALRIHF